MLEAGRAFLTWLSGILRVYVFAVTAFYMLVVTNHLGCATILYPLRTFVFRPLGAENIWSQIVSSITTIFLIHDVYASLRDIDNLSKTWNDYWWGCWGAGFLFMVLAAGSVASELAGIPWGSVSVSSGLAAFMFTMASGCSMYWLVHTWRNFLEDFVVDALEIVDDH
ncbi:hypothetical protein AC578_1676 [Pseudocercospora eumusae]|uniref:Uncharacterized protein n=1 Tax=Pseudocercospora eumusae TaxID=321146 RepID=A0A139GXL5_9PEZI|nr:hypothetical protein AC578_1676 [Pseudocercospora eumusae]